MKTGIFLSLTLAVLGFNAYCQKTAEEYLKDAPIKLQKDACAYTEKDLDLFIEPLDAYCDSLLADIMRRKETASYYLSPANGERVLQLLGKLTDFSYKYTEKYFCLTNHCPELLSGEEIAKLDKYKSEIANLIKFREDVITMKVKESQNPDWAKELIVAEEAYCSILSPKFKQVLEQELAELKLILPDYHTYGTLTISGTPEVQEIEALSAVHNYLTKFSTNTFISNMKLQFHVQQK